MAMAVLARSMQLKQRCLVFCVRTCVSLVEESQGRYRQIDIYEILV